MSNLWVLIKNGSVVKCLTNKTNEAGDWREAVEVPLNMPPRHIIDGHYFDISKNPVEIIYKTKEVTVEDRKSSLISRIIGSKNEELQKEIIKNFDLNCDSECCENKIMECVNFMKEKKAQISSLQNHDDIDSIELSLENQ